MSEKNPVELFGLGADASPEEVRAAFKERAKTAHPDSGGALDDFQRLNEEYHAALAHAELPRICPVCRGYKKVPREYSGFTASWKPCENCSGNGKIVIK